MPPENKIDCPALHKRSDSYPFGDRVPRTVRMLKTVTADPMPGIGLAYIKGDAPVAKEGQTYRVWTNSHGAVTAVMGSGVRLGLRPAEFEVDSWHHLAGEPTPQTHPEPIAWMVGTAIWWHKAGAERDSEERSEPMVPLGPCDSPSEIARVTAQFKEWQASHHRNYCKAADERDELRGQLDQARQLLHTASIRLANWLEPGDDPRKQIIAFLEEGAEPSSPPAPYPNRLCHIDYTAHPHRCGCLKGDEESQRIYDEHCRAALERQP
jgi:hypothetical protein